jgi:hypothetical protein
MPKALSRLPEDLRKKFKLDKPHLQEVTVSDLKALGMALKERGTRPSDKQGRACSTCCCCCAASSTLEAS